MLGNIRGAVKDENVVYLFLDNTSYHRNTEVREEMKKLNIEPFMNVAYSF